MAEVASQSLNSKNEKEGERVAHSYPGAAYILPADNEERDRLASQHEFLKRCFGGRNLLAPVEWREGDRLLDACTGTGHWIVEVADEVPEYVQLEGIDIESRLFPPVDSRPENLNLSIHSVLSLPKEWTDRFTVVHQRLLVVALRRAEWAIALKELYRVTKPGGWVQLCEFGIWKGGPLMNEMWDKLIRTFTKVGFIFDCGQHLEPMLRDAGFVDIKVNERFCPLGKLGGELGVMSQRNALAVWKAMGKTIVNADKDVWVSEEEFLKFIDRLLAEIEEIKTDHRWVVCLGRKPV